MSQRGHNITLKAAERCWLCPLRTPSIFILCKLHLQVVMPPHSLQDPSSSALWLAVFTSVIFLHSSEISKSLMKMPNGQEVTTYEALNGKTLWSWHTLTWWSACAARGVLAGDKAHRISRCIVPPCIKCSLLPAPRCWGEQALTPPANGEPCCLSLNLQSHNQKFETPYQRIQNGNINAKIVAQTSTVASLLRAFLCLGTSLMLLFSSSPKQKSTQISDFFFFVPQEEKRVVHNRKVGSSNTASSSSAVVLLDKPLHLRLLPTELAATFMAAVAYRYVNGWIRGLCKALWGNEKVLEKKLCNWTLFSIPHVWCLSSLPSRSL